MSGTTLAGLSATRSLNAFFFTGSNVTIHDLLYLQPGCQVIGDLDIDGVINAPIVNVSTLNVSSTLNLLPGSTVTGLTAASLPPPLDSIALLSVVPTNTMLYTSAPNTYSYSTLSPFVRTALDDPDADTFRTTIVAERQTQTLTAFPDTLVGDRFFYTNTAATVINVAPITGFTRNIMSKGAVGGWQQTLQLRPGIEVQAWDATLQGIAALTVTSGQLLYSTGIDTFTQVPASAFSTALFNNATATAWRTGLGLAIGVNVQAYSLRLTNFSAISTTVGALPYVTGANTFSTVASTATGRDLLTSVDASDIRLKALAVGRAPGTPAANLVALHDGTDGLLASVVSISGAGAVTGVSDLTATGAVSSNTVVATTSATVPELISGGTLTIDGTGVASAVWPFVATMNQHVATTSTPSFPLATIVNAPVVGTDAANKAYVDAAATGAPPIASATYATAAVLPDAPVYAPVFQTLTSTVMVALVVDGVAVSLSDRILVKNQADNRENGIYDVTVVGSGAAFWVLTRSSDFNQAAMPRAVGTREFVDFSAGTNSGTTWALTATVTTLDPLTDPVVWVQVGGTETFVAGQGIDITGPTISVDASTQFSFPANKLTLNTLAVTDGGTGSISFTANRIVAANGAGTALSTAGAPLLSEVVTFTNSGTLTNKTVGMTGTNTFTFDGQTFDVGGATTVGNVLTVVGGSLCQWKSLSSGVGPTISVGDGIDPTAWSGTTTIQVLSDPIDFSYVLGALTLNTVPISKGGTGVTSLTDQRVVYFDAAGPSLASAAYDHDDVVTFTNPGTLTNKTVGMTGTNVFTFDGQTFDVGGATTVGNVLTVVGGSLAQWQPPGALVLTAGDGIDAVALATNTVQLDADLGDFAYSGTTLILNNVPVVKGGTGRTTFTTNRLLYYDGATLTETSYLQGNVLTTTNVKVLENKTFVADFGVNGNIFDFDQRVFAPKATALGVGDVLTIINGSQFAWATPATGSSFTAGVGIDGTALTSSIIQVDDVDSPTRVVMRDNVVGLRNKTFAPDTVGNVMSLGQVVYDIGAFPGTTGQVLTVDGSVCHWATPASGSSFTAGTGIDASALVSNIIAVNDADTPTRVLMRDNAVGLRNKVFDPDAFGNVMTLGAATYTAIAYPGASGQVLTVDGATCHWAEPTATLTGERYLGGPPPSPAGMSVFHFDASMSTFSGELASLVAFDDGSTIPAFASNTSGDALYIGYDFAPPALRAKFSSLGNPASGWGNAPFAPILPNLYYTVEMSGDSGATWFPVQCSASILTQSGAPRSRIPFFSFLETNTDIRLGTWYHGEDQLNGTLVSTSSVFTTLRISNNAVSTPFAVNGVTKHWLRLRLITPFIAVPAIRMINAFSHCTRVSSNGFVEYFGYASPTRSLGLSFIDWNPNTGSAPISGEVRVSANVSFNAGNLFSSASYNAVTTVINVPEDIDTSHPITVRWGWTLLNTGVAPSTAGEEYDTFRVYWSYSPWGSSYPRNVDMTVDPCATEQYVIIRKVYDDIIGVDDLRDRLMEAFVNIDISELVGYDAANHGNADMLFVTIARDGPAGTVTQGMRMVFANCTYRAQSGGGYDVVL